MKKKLLTTALLLILIAGYALYKTHSLLAGEYDLPSTEESDSIVVRIAKGSTASSMVRDLTEKKIIRHPLLVRTYLRLSGKDKKLRAGHYFIPTRVSSLQLIELLINGREAYKTVTVREGMASFEYYGLLKAHFDVDSLTLDSLMNSPAFAAKCSVQGASLEGFLFPDTYQFPYESTEDELLSLMIQHFWKKWREIADSVSLSPILMNYGLNGLLTLASIVEKEAMVKKEQRLIAGVFYNRLKKNWPLGADPTVRYHLRKLTGTLYKSDLAVDSDYNTRVLIGLPPGPISNPGLDALLATAFPEETEHMFFVAKDDGSREHYFSENNSKHDTYKEKRQENRKKQE